ncbi:exopolyphosphatase [Paucilactobacillus suebicus]|uniref:Exopolyphosphatase n=1 Tax=Paucilactobacillus suebicus DSM 5007 = KCTC 3549 TaxID=1423807 RepID=A0A0R1WC22_9LACO|nr:exopolyphosphatase [Paucilactobacillus suebicus]KRM11772.1 exopolyphosphatase [Paucilactobacillus suebicus DSM 5007 = KCTC 3549]
MSQPNLTAQIVINAQSIDLCITDLKKMKIIEQASAPVTLGDHLFISGGITAAIVDDAIDVLVKFKMVMADYGVTDANLVASHAVSQAENINFIQDQIYIQTGMRPKLLTVNEELMYRVQACAAFLPHFKKLIQKGIVIIQVGASMMTLTIFQDGQITLAQEVPLGPLRVAQTLKKLERQVVSYEDVLDEYLYSKLLEVWKMIPEQYFDRVILMGSKLTLLENLIPKGERAVELTHQDFDQHFNDVMKLSDQDLDSQLPQMEADEVAPLFLMLDQIFDHLQVKDINLTDIKLTDGLIANLNAQDKQTSNAWNYDQMILDEAQNISKRYLVDQDHQQQVLKFAMQLFDRLKKFHGLSKRDRLLLQLSAILADTGLYLNSHHHSFHSEYIIEASEIIGINENEQQIVAAVARYHSSSSPSLNLNNLVQFQINDKLRIAKLAAILRLADALDDSHLAKIKKITLHLDNESRQIEITASADKNIALEQLTFQQKADFFQTVYGLKPILKSSRK